MNQHEARIAKVRGAARQRSLAVRGLSASMSNSECMSSMLALVSRTDLEPLCGGTEYAANFGQDPQAFQRGQMFEARLKNPRYNEVIRLLRDTAGFPIGPVSIADLRGHTPPNLTGLKQRATETQQLLRKIIRKDRDAPNIIDGAVLTCTLAGQTAYFEADGLAAAAGGKIHVAEAKSFPITDGRCDNDKLGAACDQAAWYALLCRHALARDGLPPDAVSSQGFILLPQGVGLRPTLLVQDLASRIRRAERLLAAVPDVAEMLNRAGDVTFPDPDSSPPERLDKLEHLLDTVGTHYRPDCLRDCALARLCRARAHHAGSPTLCGSMVVRQMPGVRTLSRAAELAAGAKAASVEMHAARALARAGAVYDRILLRGEL